MEQFSIENLSADTLLLYSVVFVGAIFFFYTLFLIYHWFSYGKNPLTNLLTLIVYLAGSALCFLGMFASFAYL